jgi:hypothetical protein
VDFRVNEKLVLFQFYAYLRSLVSSAMWQRVTSPANFLGEKDISSIFYLRKLLALKDICRQFGLPDAMVTVSPCDATGGFPIPTWLNAELSTLGSSLRTSGGVIANIHFGHVIHEVARVLLGGVASTGKQQKFHLLSTSEDPSSYNNVRTFFVRLESQKRGTVHGHILFWLSDFGSTTFAERLTDEIHPAELGLSRWISKIQVNSRRSHLGEPRIRRYVGTLLAGLRSHNDITVARGDSLSYVCTYSSKASDALVNASELNVRATSDPSLRHGEVEQLLASVEMTIPEAALQLSRV